MSTLPLRDQVIAFARQQIAKQPVYLDTETTGLGQNAEIIEIAVIDHAGQPLFQSLVRPSQPIPADAAAIHGIRNEDVRDAQPWPVVWSRLKPLISGRPIAAYNAEFDLRMMKQSMLRYRLNWRETFSAIDIMQIFAEYRGEWDASRAAYRFFSLEEAGRFLGIPLPNSHRALDDALLARAVLHAVAGLPY